MIKIEDILNSYNFEDLYKMIGQEIDLSENKKNIEIGNCFLYKINKIKITGKSVIAIYLDFYKDNETVLSLSFLPNNKLEIYDDENFIIFKTKRI